MMSLTRKASLSAAFAMAFGGTALAADFSPPPMTAPVVTPDIIAPYSWAGHYHGLQGGGIWGGDDGDGVDGAIAGVFGGWNWQNGSFVYGLEANANYAFGDADGFQGNIRGRFGHALADRWLVYGTAGVAGADLEDDFGVGYTVGGGVEYAAWDHASVRLDYAYTDIDDSNAHTLMLGVAFRNGGLFNW